MLPVGLRAWTAALSSTTDSGGCALMMIADLGLRAGRPGSAVDDAGRADCGLEGNLAGSCCEISRLIAASCTGVGGAGLCCAA